MQIYDLSLNAWIGLDLFNDDTHPSGHISRPTHVNVSQSCFHFLNKLVKPGYIVQVWRLVEVNKLHQIVGWFKWVMVQNVWPFISYRRIPLLVGIPLCKSRALSRRAYSMSLCSIPHDIPVTPHTQEAYSQWSVFDHNGKQTFGGSPGQYIGFGGLGMTNSMSGDCNFFSSG